MRRFHRGVPVVATCIGLMAGCGGGAPSAAVTTTVTSTTVTVTSTTATPTTSIAALDRQRILDDARTSMGAPGALAVVRKGDVSWFGSSGAADLDGTAITADTRFRIASITKPVVAILVLDAVSRREVGLDDVVADILPGIVRPDPPITVRMLLAHTSGVFDEGNDGNPLADIALLTDPALNAEGQDLLRRWSAGEHVVFPARLFIALAEAHDRYFAPGSGYHYSNTNYQLAAMVLETRTGQSLADLLRTRIVEPLGLRRTTIAPADRRSPELRSYTLDATTGQKVDRTDDLVALGNGGSGGIIATADELLQIFRALMAGRLLPPDLLAQMEQATEQSYLDYGLGLATYYLSCGNFYGHQGSVDGTESIALVSQDGESGVVVAVNLRGATAPNMTAVAEQFLCES